MSEGMRKEFILAAISDAQELIRFIDTKIGVVFVIIGGIITVLLSLIGNIIIFLDQLSYFFLITVFVLIVLIFIDIILITRIIKPTQNPMENIEIGSANIPKLRFFLPENKYIGWYPFINNKSHKLKESYDDYLTIIKEVNKDEVLESLTFELLKLSFIRNIKNDRFSILIWVLLATSFIFIFALVLYNIEINLIKNCHII